MINEKKYYFFLVFFVVGNFLYSQQSKVRFELKKPPGSHGKILKENISVEIRKDNIGSELLSLSKRIKYWPFPEPENIVEVKFDFASYLSSIGGKPYLLISYKGEKNKWEPIKIKLHNEWFDDDFRDSGRAIKKRFQDDIDAYWGENVICSSPYNQYKKKGYYKFDIVLEEKHTKIIGTIRDSKNSEPIVDASVLINSRTNKKLMGDNYSRNKRHGRDKTNIDGDFEFDLKYTEPVDSLKTDGVFFIIIIKENYKPLIETGLIKSIGDEISIGDIYLELWDMESKEHCVSDKLEWSSDCKRCVCKEDIELRYYANKDVCSIADCGVGKVIQWNKSIKDYMCVPQIVNNNKSTGSRIIKKGRPYHIFGPSDFSFISGPWTNSENRSDSVGDDCSETFDQLYQDIRSCNFNNTNEKALHLYSDCPDILSDKSNAQLLARVLYLDITNPENQTSENYIKEMLLEGLESKDTHYGKTVAAFSYFQQLPIPNKHNKESYVQTEKAELYFQEAMLYIRLADVMIKEKIIPVYNTDIGIKYPIEYHVEEGKFGYDNRARLIEIEQFIAIILNTKIPKYESVSKKASVEENYQIRSLDEYKEYFNMIVREDEFD